MNEQKQTFWEKLATLIVDKRNIFFLFFIAASIFCVISSDFSRRFGEGVRQRDDCLPNRREHQPSFSC